MKGANVPGLVGEERIAELERHRQAGLCRLIAHLAPLTERMIDEWAPVAAGAGHPVQQP